MNQFLCTDKVYLSPNLVGIMTKKTEYLFHLIDNNL